LERVSIACFVEGWTVVAFRSCAFWGVGREPPVSSRDKSAIVGVPSLDSVGEATNLRARSSHDRRASRIVSSEGRPLDERIESMVPCTLRSSISTEGSVCLGSEIVDRRMERGDFWLAIAGFLCFVDADRVDCGVRPLKVQTLENGGERAQGADWREMNRHSWHRDRG
jgi:hypothetical protein